MNQPRIAMLASQDKLLREFFSSNADGHERAAVVLFKRLNITVGSLARSDRYIAVAV